MKMMDVFPLGNKQAKEKTEVMQHFTMNWIVFKKNQKTSGWEIDKLKAEMSQKSEGENAERVSLIHEGNEGKMTQNHLRKDD